MSSYPVNLAEQIRCVQRELGMRTRVYPKLIERGKITAANAQRELDAMKAVLETLLAVQAGRVKGFEGYLEK